MKGAKSLDTHQLTMDIAEEWKVFDDIIIAYCRLYELWWSCFVPVIGKNDRSYSLLENSKPIWLFGL